MRRKVKSLYGKFKVTISHILEMSRNTSYGWIWQESATNFCIISSKRQIEGELRHVVQIDVAVFRKGESKTL